VGTTPGRPGANPRTINIPVDVFGVANVHALINNWAGQPGPNSYAYLEFFGSEGAYFRKDLIGDDDIRDYLFGMYTNNINGITTTNVFTAGEGRFNQVRLDKLVVSLPDEFLDQTLSTIRVSDNGGEGFQRVLLVGLTVETPE
jgi:hypothetical protein